jgi:hypothetical protein
MSTKIRNRFIQGLEKNGWKHMTSGRGRHGWAFFPPKGITSDHNIKFLTVSQDVDENVIKWLQTELRRFYCIKNGVKINYSREQALEISCGNKTSFE